MEFYHILPSNTSPDFFPNNKAEEYSTQIDKPYELEGKWEAGLLDIVHSNCVNTFNNDKIYLTSGKSTKEVLEDLKHGSKGFTITIPSPAYNPQRDNYTLRNILMKNINEVFEDLLYVDFYGTNTEKVLWAVKSKKYNFQPSPFIRELFNCWQVVYSPYDYMNTNYNKMPTTIKSYTAKDIFINVFPTKEYNSKFLVESITLKKAGETITPAELLKRVETRVKSNVMRMELKSKKHFQVFAGNTDGLLIMLSEHLTHVLRIRMSSIEQGRDERYFSHRDFKLYKDKAWEVYVYNLKDRFVPTAVRNERIITLEPCHFDNGKKAIEFLNEKLDSNLCVFKYHEADNLVQLEIFSNNLKLILDENLRSILGLSRNEYNESQVVMARSTFSLTRCIQFLYVYSNIGENIRVGNTEAPLIGTVPFTSNNKMPNTKEKNFKKPMYVQINRNHIQQIDIKIYDGAGQLVPFVKDSITSLRLHIRRSLQD